MAKTRSGTSISADNRTEKRKLGDFGEKLACQFLVKRGYKIVERNYLKKWGEIDIIAEKEGILHFVEVKSVKGTVSDIVSDRNVSHVTNEGEVSREMGSWRPEENVHPQKLRRLARTMQTYVLEKRVEGEWRLDVVTVKIDDKRRVARVEIIENVVI